MEHEVFALRDLKGAYYRGGIMLHRSEGDAKRAFQNACKTPDSVLYSNPEDFQLVRLGKFDDCSGNITSLKIPEIVASALDYQEQEAQV